MFALLTVSSTLLAVSNGYQYFAGPLSYENAKAYCYSIGTTLATIVDDADRAAARTEILTEYGAGGVWIGLEDVSQTEGGYFSYPDEPDDTCPIDQGGLCVPFWINGEPLCVGKEGYTCTQFYQGALDNQGGVNNDIPCDTRRPFLCNDSPPMSVCPQGLDFRCGGSISKCGESGPLNFCFCDATDAGSTSCVEDAFCSQAQVCSFRACPAGQVCLPTQCCRVPVCVPLCEPEVTRRLAAGEMTEDEYEAWKEVRVEREKERERRRLMEGEEDPICTNAYCDAEVAAALMADDGASPAQVENGMNDMNGLEELMDNNKMELIELLSLNVMVSVLVTLFVLCMVYVCCFRGRQTTNKHEKDDKMKYDKVGGAVDEDEIDEMM